MREQLSLCTWNMQTDTHQYNILLLRFSLQWRDVQHNCTFLDNIFRLDYLRGYDSHNTQCKIFEIAYSSNLSCLLQRTFGSELQKMAQIPNLTPSSSFASSLSFEDCPQMTTAIDELHQVNSTIRVSQQLCDITYVRLS